MKSPILHQRLFELVCDEMELLKDYSQRNLGVSHDEARAADKVVQAGLDQLRTYGMNISDLERDYFEIKQQCRESWGKHQAVVGI